MGYRTPRCAGNAGRPHWPICMQFRGFRWRHGRKMRLHVCPRRRCRMRTYTY